MTVPNIDMDVFKKAEILDENGKSLPIAQLWKDHTAVLVFLRHFGCIACRAHAAQLWEKRGQIEKDGAKIFLIGNGKPEIIKSFKQDLKIDFPVYTDPSLETFTLAHFKRGILSTIGPSALAGYLTLKAAGYKQTGIDGDIWQQGGVMVVKPSGQLVYHFVSEAPGDKPKEETIAQNSN